jgi:hypothetical protein
MFKAAGVKTPDLGVVIGGIFSLSQKESTCILPFLMNKCSKDTRSDLLQTLADFLKCRVYLFKCSEFNDFCTGRDLYQSKAPLFNIFLKNYNNQKVEMYDYYKPTLPWMTGGLAEFGQAKVIMEGVVARANLQNSFINNLEEATRLISSHVAENILDVTDLDSTVVFIPDRVDTADFSYTPEELRRRENVIEIPGDGNCLFRSLLEALGLDQKKHITLRWAIASYMENKQQDFVSEGFIDLDTLKGRINALRTPSEFGEETDILVFEKMSGINVMVYQEIYDDNGQLIKIAVNRGLKSDKYIAILHCKLTGETEKPNHFRVMRRDVSKFQSHIDQFKKDFLEEPVKDDNLPKKVWENNGAKPKGKNKVLIDCTGGYVNYTRWKEGKLGPAELNNISYGGLDVYTYYKDKPEYRSFYTLEGKQDNKKKKKANAEKCEGKISFRENINKNTPVPDICSTWNSNWTDESIKKIGIDEVYKTIPKNMKFEKNTNFKDFTSGKHQTNIHLRQRILHCICHLCSGKSYHGNYIFKYIPNFDALVNHASTHSDEVPAESFVNVDIDPKVWRLVRASAKPLTFYLIKHSTVKEILGRRIDEAKSEEDDEEEAGECEDSIHNLRAGGVKPISIYGWNARSLFKEENIYYVSEFLTSMKPDILMVNESGEYKERLERLNKLYKLHHSSNTICVLHKKNINVTPIWRESWDSVYMILKVSLENKSLLLVNCYRSPSYPEYTNRIISLLLGLNKKYEDTPIVLFGDLNYRREQIDKVFKKILDVGFKFIFSNDPEDFTFFRDDCKSYLDYFVTKGIKDYVFEIIEPIGHSDHKTVLLNITQEDLKIKRIFNFIYSFTKVKLDSNAIGMRMIEALTHEVKTPNMIRLVRNLRMENKPNKIRYRSHFKVIEKLVGVKDWETIKSIIKNANTESFTEFMSCFEKLKLSRRDREYFARLRFYTELARDVNILEDLSICDSTGEELVTTDRIVIDYEVNKKYLKLFRGNNGKDILPLIGNGEVITYTPGMVLQALCSLNLDKATSWDFIPGKSYEAIKKDPVTVINLTEFINEIVSTSIPRVFNEARLMCLNKNAREPGKIDSIRPIAIVSVIIKVIEFHVLEELKTLQLNTSQIGFRKGLSTEVNILRLRQRLHDLRYTGYDRKSKMKKRYILFIDLKQAFDCVDYPKLILKLITKGLSAEHINTIIKLYNSSYISINLRDGIPYNQGVGQGKLCSPLEFNIYIDDLLDEVKCYCSLAFADDTCFITEDETQLHQTITTVENWCVRNNMEINKKKSGILIINEDTLDCSKIRGYPVVNSYKYLGLKLNSQVNPKSHISDINNKLVDYLKRNFLLRKSYFSPFSLIRLIEYFVKSRLCYGLCCYLDSKASMDKIQNTIITHIKSIFGLPVHTSHKRIQLVLGEVSIAKKLAVRLLNNWYKYKSHFGVYPEIFRQTLQDYFTDLDNREVDMRSRFKLFDDDLKKLGEEYGLSIRVRHRETLKRFWFTNPDLGDFYIIRFFTQTAVASNSRLFPICKCGADNSAEHTINDCPEAKINRFKLIDNFRRIYREEQCNLDDLSLFKLLEYGYFTANLLDFKSKNRQDIVRMTKTTLRAVIIAQGSSGD